MPWICAGDIAYAMGVTRDDQPWALSLGITFTSKQDSCSRGSLVWAGEV